MITIIKKIVNDFYTDSLYKNSFFLLFSTGILAFFGFLFWVINTKLYSPQQIGIATTLISVTSLVMNISMLGFNNAIIKYLPKAKDKASIISTSLTIVILISFIVSLIYLLGINFFSPSLEFIKSNLLYSLIFIFIMIVSTLNIVTDSIFIARRDSIYIFIYSFLMNITKLSLPFFMVSLGAIGIFLSYFGGTFTAFLLTFIFLYTRYSYIFKPEFKKSLAKHMIEFSSKTYSANFISGLPAMLLPIIITNKLGPQFTAYYYIAMMIASTIYLIPTAITRSFFAEGAHQEVRLKVLILKTIKINSIFLMPIVFIVYFFGQNILLAFGKQFSTESYLLLQLLTISSIFITISSIGNTILNIKGKLNTVIMLSFINAIIILSSVYLFQLSLLMIGNIWLLSNIITALITSFIIYKYYLK